MSDPKSFADVFTQTLDKRSTSIRAAARLSKISRRTLENWSAGKVRRPRSWRQLVQLARALRLTADETNQLLTAATHPPLEALNRRFGGDSEGDLAGPWLDS